MLMRFLLASIFATIALPSAQAELSARIINGSDSPIGPDGGSTYPWMASLQYNNEHFCGGVLIDPQYVLTAAHCAQLITYVAPAVRIVLGTRDLRSNAGVVATMSGVILHPQFNSTNYKNDIALLKLSSPVNVPPVKIAMPGESQSYQPGNATLALGWGQTSATAYRFPYILQQVTMPLQSDAECSRLNGTFYDSNSMACAGTLSSSYTVSDGTDTCAGDSGGPLLSMSASGVMSVVGITSFGIGNCAAENAYGIYAKVAASYDFIQSKPDVTPYPITVPTISGQASPGHRLVCDLGKWGGEPATSVSIKWVRYLLNEYDTFPAFYPDTETIIPNANSRSYLVKQSDLDHALVCSVRLSNSGGGFEMRSSSTAVNTQSTPQELPNVPTIQQVSCNSRFCTLSVLAGPTDDYMGVVGQVEIQVKGKKGRRAVGKQLKATSTDGETWSFTYRTPTAKTYSFAFRSFNFDKKFSKLKRVNLRRKVTR